MPHRLAITCPDCKAEAAFEFAEYVRIKTKADLKWFEASDTFDCLKVRNSDGQFVHVAAYYHKLKSNSMPSVEDLPPGYDISNWNLRKYRFSSSHGRDGTIVCERCGIRRKHTLNWPEEAFFQIDYKGNVLWAFDRQSTAELIDYIGSSHRKADQYSYWPFLMKIPSIFLSSHARQTVIARLKACLR